MGNPPENCYHSHMVLPIKTPEYEYVFIVYYNSGIFLDPLDRADKSTYKLMMRIVNDPEK